MEKYFHWDQNSDSCSLSPGSSPLPKTSRVLEVSDFGGWGERACEAGLLGEIRLHSALC